MLEHLFGSKTRVKLLRLLFRHPEQAFFVRELARFLEVQLNAVRREIMALLALGLVFGVEENRSPDEAIKAGSSLRKYYRLNKDSALYPELQALLIKEQLIAEEQFIKDLQQKVGQIDLMLLTGRFTHDNRAPSDLLLVGDLNEKSVARLVAVYEHDFGSPIRYTTMTRQEFTDRRYVMDKFLFSLFEAQHVKTVNRLGL